ncbi:MAG: AmiS/UreI family transporter [Geminicoccaceae bacterium]
MMLGLALLWVGAVLFLNGLWILGKVGDREIIVINVASGLITMCVALYSAFGPGASDGSIRAAALTLLFTTTYLWVAYNRMNEVDGRGLGWFSLFVAVTVLPVALSAFANIHSTLDLWMAWNWAAWSALWFMFFLLLALQKPIARMTGMVTAAEGVLTGWLPGLLILQGYLATAPAHAG